MDIEKLYSEGDRSIKTIIEYAIHLNNLGKVNEAINVLLDGLNHYANSSLLYTILGKIYLQERNYNRAVIYFKKAYDLDRFNYQAVEGLVECSGKLGLKKNREYFEKVAEYLYPFRKKESTRLPGIEELEEIAEEGRDLIE